MTNLHAVAPHFQGLKFRCIGPPRGGRVLAVAGHPTEAMTFYFGGCAGGVWKTVDGGAYWENISDGFLNSAAVGALTVSTADPNVIYAGMGEATIRLDVSYGDGVYKSTDGGKTWQHKGLTDTKHIGEIRVHPQNADLVYVAALGHGFGPNSERGVYRSTDGGDTWELVLHKSDKAGAVDLAMDVTNPRILFASIYETHRKFWTLSSGGEDSGLWKSTDGGDTWIDITQNKGMPKGILGKIGVTISPANPNRVWAIIECEDAGLYRSDDGGETWNQVSDNRDLIHRPWYYCHVFADPADLETVYINNLKMWKSVDGGHNFSEITTLHGDNHDLWIDPNNTQRMIQGNDGGANISFNGGVSWSTVYNQKTAQFYHVAVDNRYPYHVYGTQQDNSSIAVPSATEKGAVTWGDCYPAGTGESGYIAPHPEDPNIVYVGAIGSSPGGGNCLQRYDHRTKQIRLITVWPDAYFGWGSQDMKYRFAWTYPIVFSPHDANVIYVAGNHIFKTTNEGQSWEPISPDLSRADPEKLVPSGGPLTLDTSGAENYATVFAFVESPHQAGVFWAGTDDGLVHLSMDGGANWEDITPASLPEWALVSVIEASPHDPATVYLAATRYKLDDYAPYLFKSTDYGRTWQTIDSFPAGEITRVIREDPNQAGLLFVGTETGIYVSFNSGDSWERLQGGGVRNNQLPVVPVYDIKIKEDDLVIGTHGRSFWILDDITPLRSKAANRLTDIYLHPPRQTYRQWLGWFVNAFRGPGKNYMMSLGMTMTFTEEKDDLGEQIRNMLDAGENPPYGVIIYYNLPDDLSDELTLTILDSDGNEIRAYGTKPPEPANKKEAEAQAKERKANERFISSNPGLNRFVWNMRYPDAVEPTNDPSMEGASTGPQAKPGNYQVRLTVGEHIQTQPFEIQLDPNVSATTEDMEAQFALWDQINNKLSKTHEAGNKIASLRDQIDALIAPHKVANGTAHAAAAEIIEMADAAKAKLSAIEDELIQTKSQGARDRLRLPSRLNAKLANLVSVVGSCDAAPTDQTYEVFNEVSAKVDDQLAMLDGIIGDDLEALNDLVRQANIPAIIV